MIIDIPASIIFEKGIRTDRYEWKSKDKSSVYSYYFTKARLKIACAKFGKKLKETKKDKRQVSVKFIKEKAKWIAIIHRVHSADITVSAMQ